MLLTVNAEVETQNQTKMKTLYTVAYIRKNQVGTILITTSDLDKAQSIFFDAIYKNEAIGALDGTIEYLNEDEDEDQNLTVQMNSECNIQLFRHTATTN